MNPLEMADNGYPMTEPFVPWRHYDPFRYRQPNLDPFRLMREKAYQLAKEFRKGDGRRRLIENDRTLEVLEWGDGRRRRLEWADRLS